jgi:hypothetical protein
VIFFYCGNWKMDATIPLPQWTALMDEQPRPYRNLLALLLLPLAIVVMVPAVVVLGVAFYGRAAFLAGVSLIRFLLTRNSAKVSTPPTQPPHFLETKAPSKKTRGPAA